jgi:hypothetical protein
MYLEDIIYSVNRLCPRPNRIISEVFYLGCMPREKLRVEID